MKKGQYGDLNLNVSFNLSVNQEMVVLPDSKIYVTCKLATLTESVSPKECFSGFYLVQLSALALRKLKVIIHSNLQITPDNLCSGIQMYIRTVIVQKGFSQIKYFSEMLRNTASFSLTDEWQFNGYIYHTYPGNVFMLL